MPTLREITIDWTSPNTPGGTTVLHFDATATPLFQRQAVADALTIIKDVYCVGTIATIATEGREFDDATGTLTGTWAEGTVLQIPGTSAGDQVPNAAQALLRFQTSTVVDGRLLKGRMFIPGIDLLSLDDGELSSTTVALIGAAWTSEVVTPATGFSVWSRPRPAREEPPLPARSGSSALVTSSSCWAELAVLRKRR